MATEEGWRCPPDDFRVLLQLGFQPDEKTLRMIMDRGPAREEALKIWRAQCAQSETDWLLCPECQAQARRLRGEGEQGAWWDNRWKNGRVNLVVPPLSDALRGAEGCFFQEGIFDSTIGKEVFLLILEQRGPGSEMVATRPFHILCAPGLANTSHGPVFFIIWTVAAGSPQETEYEQFLNPTNSSTLLLLLSISRQRELKVVVLESTSGEVLDFFLFENTFELEQMLEPVEQIIGEEITCRFGQAIQEFQRLYSIEDLRGY